MERSTSNSAHAAPVLEPPALALQAPPDSAWLDRVLRPGRRRSWPISGPASPVLRGGLWLGTVFVIDSSPGGGLLARARALGPPAAGGSQLELEIIALPAEAVPLERLLELEVLERHAVFAQPEGLFFTLDADQAAALEQLIPPPSKPVIELCSGDLTVAAREALARAEALRERDRAKELEIDLLLRSLEETSGGQAHRLLHRKGPVLLPTGSPALVTYRLDEPVDDEELLALVEAEVQELLSDYSHEDDVDPSAAALETGWRPPLRIDDVEIPLSGLTAEALGTALAGTNELGPVGTVELLSGVLSTVERHSRGATLGTAGAALGPAGESSPDAGRRSEPGETSRPGAKAGAFALPTEPAVAKQIDGGERGSTAEQQERADELSERRLQSALLRGGERLPADQPLVLGVPCSLRVGIDRRDWGLGEPGRDLDRDLDARDFARHGGLLPLRVAVRSHGFDVSPALGRLDLPEQGPSAVLDFTVVPRHTGRRHVDVDLLFEGRLLRTRRVEALVVAAEGESLPETAWPVQDAYDVFDGVEALHRQAVEARARRRLSITVERDGEAIGLRFYRWDGEDLGFAETRLSSHSLSSQLESLRASLARTMRALTGFVGFEDVPLFTEHLAKLASVGRTFRRNLLREADSIAGFGDALDAAEVVQVAPLSNQVGVPWELLYDRAIETWRERHAQRIRLCPSLAAGTAPERDAVCPSCGDSAVVCPNGFWGFRRVVEQLPYRRRSSPAPALPPSVLGDRPPIRVDACTFRDFHHRRSHLANLASLAARGRWQVHEACDLDAVRAALERAGDRTDLLYFYAHGGVDAYGRPFVKIGAGEELLENDFEAWQLDLRGRRPLVMLNICDSAHYDAESFENLIQLFIDSGASGVIATQCDIRELLADAVARDLLARLLANEPVGPALLATRRALLDRSDPRGLVYSLFAESELRYAAER